MVEIKTLREKAQEIKQKLEEKQGQLSVKTVALGEFKSQTVTAPALLIYCIPESSETHAGAQSYLDMMRVTVLAIPEPAVDQATAMFDAIELLERAEKVLIEAQIGLAKQPQMVPFFSEQHSDLCAVASQFLTPYKKHV